MRCLLCAAEMVVMQVVVDSTMSVPGFERHTFQCPSCGDVEQRLMFNRGAQDEARPVEVPAPQVAPASATVNPEGASSEGRDDNITAPPVSPDAAAESDPVTSASVWARALAKLRGH
jgi:hypothetical protein